MNKNKQTPSSPSGGEPKWQRLAPWVVTAVAALWILASLRTPHHASDYAIDDFGRIPVVANGRVQPMDSLARNCLLMLRGRQSLPDDTTPDKRDSLSAMQWLLEVMTMPEKADTRKIFRIDNLELKGLLKLPEEASEKFFAFSQIKEGWEEIQRQSERIAEIEEQRRTPFEKSVMKVHFGLGLYFRLKNTIRPESTADFAEEVRLFQRQIAPGLAALREAETNPDFDRSNSDLQLVVKFFRRYEMLSKAAYAHILPPQSGSHDKNDWRTVGASLMESIRGQAVHPAIMSFAAMTQAYAERKPSDFNKEVAAYRASLSPEYKTELAKGGWEFFYNEYAPFIKNIYVYMAAFLFGCAYWFNLSKWLNRTSWLLLVLALVVHTTGLIFRMMLEGRPPVTNLYSSAIFVGWGAVVLGVVLERFFKDGIGGVTAASIGVCTLIIAHNLSLGGDTMEMMRAVLDTNFWLATHVVVITLGYSAMFVAGALAIIYIARGLFTSSMSQNTAKALTRMVYGIICFATLFSFVGTILGGIWADQSWGRFWGWDPKENGALLIVIWCAIILHARWGGMIRERGIMACAVFGNIVTAFSWFGVNMLGVGLHSYGFMDKAFNWLMLFNGTQVVFIILAMLPLKYWRILPSPGKPGGSPANPGGSAPVLGGKPAAA